MKLLYGTWGEITFADCVHAWEKINDKVTVFHLPVNYQAKEDEKWKALQKILGEGYDFVFTFNFFPVLSNLCQEKNIPYLSWVYDSPHYTLMSKAVFNDCNHIFVFDKEECLRLRDMGITTVYYEPLAVNETRLSKQLADIKGYSHGVSFVGNLYRDSYNFWDQIAYLPEHLRGYVDGVMAVQQFFYGYDMVQELLTPEKIQELSIYIKAGLGDEFLNCRQEILKNIIRKKITVEERWTLLSKVGAILKEMESEEKLTLCCKENPEGIEATHLGYVDYDKTMPQIFRQSKINLNITLRSIQSGIPLRVLDVLGAGGFLLTNYQAEIPEYFAYEKELVWFESHEDLYEKVKFYLPKESLRQSIAEQGRKRVADVFSYEYRLKRILKQAGIS